jgi:hypothetical protein
MEEIVNALYWYLHTSYLYNNRERAEKFATLMDVEIEKTGVTAKTALGYTHFGRYLKIRDNMDRGFYGRLSLSGYSTPSHGISSIKHAKSDKEKKFCRSLLKRKKEILELVESPDGSMTPEFNLKPFGRCDFVSLDRNIRVSTAIEVKMGDAPSSVVSQIDKYMVALELDMIKQTHDEVRGFVIAESFSYQVATELARMGVGMIEHSNGKFHIIKKMV